MNADNIITEAEAEALQDPRQPNVPGGIELPKNVLDLIKKWEKAHKAWTEADARNVAATDAYHQAERHDKEAFDAAAKAGKERRPERTAPALLDDVEFAATTAKHRREEVTALAEQIDDAVNADPDLVWKITSQVLEALDQYVTDVDEIKRLWGQANARYAAPLRNMTFVRERMKGRLTFDSNYAHHSVPTIVWPDQLDAQQRSLRALIQNVREMDSKN